MNTFDFVERHHRIRLICHAIRHLLDHTATQATCSDVEAIDILQSAINPAEENSGADGRGAGECAAAEQGSNPAAQAQLEEVLEYVR